ncbi:hypothetical protein BDV28DRAFT_30603 [Aspergillus coremiiformis]|uniref:BTB domain-containing protein n=1 Tax=Aspergillus coremiiformis TaxID=138285 RepID=A0A5N6ZDA8_9EURO|nr:hypothetical protein BDV28DRAFT_30603 [Aspergillus coremiiformis]
MKTGKSSTYAEFLISDFVSLKTTTSTHIFKVHKALLDIKCKSITPAFNGNYTESQDSIYTFSDTSHETLARFIEWAYRADYTEPTEDTDGDTSTLPSDDEEWSTRPQDTTTGDQSRPVHHSLLAHMDLYIFSDVYIIPELKALAFTKIQTGLRAMGRPETPEQCLAVIALLRLASSKVPLDGSDILRWLAHFAAYNFDILRHQPSFHDTLKLSPDLTWEIVGRLKPAVDPPWPRTCYSKNRYH